MTSAFPRIASPGITCVPLILFSCIERHGENEECSGLLRGILQTWRDEYEDPGKAYKRKKAVSTQRSAFSRRGGLKANCNVGMDGRFTKSCGYSRRKKHKVPPLLHCVEKPRDDATLERRILSRSFFIEKNVSLGEC